MTKYAAFIRLLRTFRSSSNQRLEDSLFLHAEEPRYSSWYWTPGLARAICEHTGIPENKWNEQAPFLQKAAIFYARYRRFCLHMKETRHRWQFVSEVHFADNSVEVIERSELTGETRQRMTVCPHGD